VLLRAASFVMVAAGLAAAQQFEVASIRPHAGPLTRMKQLIISGSRINMEGYSLVMLVMEAYDVKRISLLSLDGVSHRPEILEGYYDIAARAPGDRKPTQNEVRQMLQSWLADRCKLVVHRAMKDTPVYRLVVAKDGPKLEVSEGTGECAVHVGPATGGRNQEAVFSNCGMDALVEQLPDLGVDRPVLDRTGLTGKYDFRMIGTPMYGGPNQFDMAVSPYAAVGDLGLKLEAQRAPMEVVTVDSVEKPGDN
jgi:uncharacterized protein (TIGR03435 family)